MEDHTKQKILEALAKLDPTENKQWTKGDVPTMELMIELTGDDTITRKMVTAADPLFTRLTAPPLLGKPAENGSGNPPETGGNPPEQNSGDNPPPPADDTPPPADEPLQVSSTTSPSELAMLVANASLGQVGLLVSDLKSRKKNIDKQVSDLSRKLANLNACLNVAIAKKERLEPKETFSQANRRALDTSRRQDLQEYENRKKAMALLGVTNPEAIRDVNNLINTGGVRSTSATNFPLKGGYKAVG